MNVKRLEIVFSVCKVVDFSEVDMQCEYFFLAKTPDENSLVCPTQCVPSNVTAQDDGWQAFYIEGVLDFSLLGILSQISTLLAQNDIPIFAISTYNTDYILTKKDNYNKSLQVLADAGYVIV